MPSSPRNRIGEVYGQLTVVRASERRTKAGNAYWWCRCTCGKEREVPGDKLSLNTARRKPIVDACETCARERQVEGVCIKNDREEKIRRPRHSVNGNSSKGLSRIDGCCCPSPTPMPGNWGRPCFSAARAACGAILRPIGSTAVVRLARVRPRRREICHQPGPQRHDRRPKGH